MGLLDFNLSDVGSLVTGVREAITGEKIKDPVEMAKIDMQLQSLENAITTGQLSINREEAKSPRIFVAGWRPFIGWVGGIALAYQFIVYPLILWGWAAWGPDDVSPPPSVDAAALYPLLLGMLGIGGMRSFDKLKRTDTK